MLAGLASLHGVIAHRRGMPYAGIDLDRKTTDRPPHNGIPLKDASKTTDLKIKEDQTNGGLFARTRKTNCDGTLARARKGQQSRPQFEHCGESVKSRGTNGYGGSVTSGGGKTRDCGGSVATFPMKAWLSQQMPKAL